LSHFITPYIFRFFFPNIFLTEGYEYGSFHFLEPSFLHNYTDSTVIRSGILKKYIPVAINKVPVAINQDMKAFIVNNQYVNSQYLMWFFKGIERNLLSKVRGVTADNIEFKQIKEHQMPAPPIELQNRFADQVEKIEQQKQRLQQSLTELENNFKALMQRAFKGELF
ncbi:restriction endonuclease subunit S, partial [Paenibacillus larvae]|uniref:restriction endonuclease subunit S n=1 Tax=Paenibacillus larvae TaxID=1464 RepID=UPI0022822568